MRHFSEIRPVSRPRRERLAQIVLLLGLSVFAGCVETQPTGFAPSERLSLLHPAAQGEVSASIVRMLGTPAALKSIPSAELADPSSLQLGRSLYLTHCKNCHGSNGDGSGPSAKYFRPRPRDFRHGVFKYTSTLPADHASDEDLTRTIRLGLPGSTMPSFALLQEHELAAVVAYVKYLAIRGEVESDLIDVLLFEHGEEAIRERANTGESREAVIEELCVEMPQHIRELCAETLELVATGWRDSERRTVKPQRESPQPNETSLANSDLTSWENGRRLYFSKEAQCVTCHGESGRGDGEQTRTVQLRPNGEPYDEPGLFDDWGHPSEPRDLTKGIYAGGDRPIDLYHRISCGIKGTKMAAMGAALSEEEIWDLVNFVRAIPERGVDE